MTDGYICPRHCFAEHKITVTIDATGGSIILKVCNSDFWTRETNLVSSKLDDRI